MFLSPCFSLNVSYAIPGTDNLQACDTVTDKARNYLHPRQNWPWTRFESSRSLSANLEVLWRYDWVYPYMVTLRRAPFQRWRIPATWTRRDSQSMQGRISGMTPFMNIAVLQSIYYPLSDSGCPAALWHGIHAKPSFRLLSMTRQR
jgi:hypothetical protein